MKFSIVYAMGLGLAIGVMALTAPAAMAAGQCEITSHRVSDGNVEVEVRNRDTGPQLASVWFRPNFRYAGLGDRERHRTLSTSGIVEPDGQQTLVVEAPGSLSSLKEPVGISLSCTPTQDA